jgi:hypothetical protein
MTSLLVALSALAVLVFAALLVMLIVGALDLGAGAASIAQQRHAVIAYKGRRRPGPCPRALERLHVVIPGADANTGSRHQPFA